ncbi:MAG: hypothetical protein KDI79_00125 [Anaerolineae bacterium]|nr:hypothetical protein [Anaerolineae bacterium]
MPQKKPFNPRLFVLIATVTGLTSLTLLTGLIWSPLPVQADPTLPPRDQPTDDSQRDKHDDDDDDDDGPAPGAYIELHVQGDGTGMWAAVQWQDSDGNWQPVEGWQGPLGSSGYQRWWVAAKDFGRGPFRWVVSAEARSAAVDDSDSFNLPSAANQTVQITVSP